MDRIWAFFVRVWARIVLFFGGVFYNIFNKKNLNKKKSGKRHFREKELPKKKEKAFSKKTSKRGRRDESNRKKMKKFYGFKNKFSNDFGLDSFSHGYSS